MFEALVTLCLAADPGICRESLIPGHEAGTVAACLATLPETLATPVGTEARGAPSCRAVADPLAFEEVADRVFVHAGAIAVPDMRNGGDVANVGFVIGNEAVAVVDAGTNRFVAEGIWRAIRARTALPVRYLILTHVHPDHVLGAPLFKAAGAEIVGHAALDRALADRQENYLQSMSFLMGAATMIGSGAVATDIAVEDTERLDLGDRVLDLRAWPVAHTGTDLTVLDRESGVLFTGDLVFDGHTPALDGRLRGWQATLTTLAGMDFAGIVPGHGAVRLDWPAGGDATRRYLDVLADDTAQAIADGARMADAVETIAGSEAKAWRLFDDYNPRNATVAFTELEWE